MVGLTPQGVMESIWRLVAGLAVVLFVLGVVSCVAPQWTDDHLGDLGDALLYAYEDYAE